MKKCYFCAEEIQDDAKKCRFCNEWIKEESEDEKDRKAFLKLYRTNLDSSDEANRILKRIGRRSLLNMYAYSIVSIAVALTFLYWFSEELKIDKFFEIAFITSIAGISLAHIIRYKRGKSAVKKLAKIYISRISEEKRKKVMESEKRRVLSLMEETRGQAGILEIDTFETAVEKAYKWEQIQKNEVLDAQIDPRNFHYREAVHEYLGLSTSLDEQKEIYLEARKLWKTDNLDDLEGYIAENFIRYAKSGEGIKGTLDEMFDKVIDRIKFALGHESKIEMLYKDILDRSGDNRID